METESTTNTPTPVSTPTTTAESNTVNTTKTSNNKNMLVLVVLLLLLLAVGLGAGVTYLLMSGNSNSTASSSASSNTSSESSSVSSQNSTSTTPSSNTTTYTNNRLGISFQLPDQFEATVHSDSGYVLAVAGEDQSSTRSRAYSISFYEQSMAELIVPLAEQGNESPNSPAVNVGGQNYPSRSFSGGDGDENGASSWKSQIIGIRSNLTIIVTQQTDSLHNGTVLSEPTARDIADGLALLASVKFN